SQIVNYLENRVYSAMEEGLWATNFNAQKHIWHKLYKKSWEQRQLSVHYEYWFDIKRFSNGQMQFMLDVEGRRSGELLDQFDTLLPSFEAELHQHGFVYRPPHRKHAIIWKEYRITTTVEEIAEQFIRAAQEASFMIPIVDQALERLAYP
ncbi:MAG: hypothetical protein KDE51_10875, partial [Anaerolineales bacterium]|nr:hypothetical protein [Anaerolineales bacterium]